MSGLVEVGVMIGRFAALRIGDIALPDPLLYGPSAARIVGSVAILRALLAACPGS